MLKNLVLIAATLMALTACNTMEGLGKDIKKAGGSIEDTANRKK